MNIEKINWNEALKKIQDEDQDDPVILGFKALLLHPSIFPSTLLQKNEVGFHAVWSRAEKVELTEEADSGNVFAQWLKGTYADIVEHDLDTALRYHWIAASKGFALSQNSLGKLYEKLGDDETFDDEYRGDQNYDTAIKYYELAAKQGHADAQYNLAIMHEPDFEQMKPYLEQAANQQHPEALFYLGNLYMESDVVERDFEMAKVCFEIAANQGHAKAMEKLVSLYLEQRLEPSFYQHVQRYVSPQPTRSPVYEEAVLDTNWFDETPDGRALYPYMN
jgi:TPR repeat protein